MAASFKSGLVAFALLNVGSALVRAQDSSSIGDVRVVALSKSITMSGDFLTTIGDAAMSRDGKVFIADKAQHRLQILNHDLSWFATVGGPGDKPGQYRDLAAVAPWKDGVIAVERYRRRLDFYAPLNGSYALMRFIQVPFEPYDVCEIDSLDIAVLGLADGMKIHVIDRDGNVSRSFAPMDSSIPPMLAKLNAIDGKLKCDVRAGTVVLTSQDWPTVEAFDLRSGTRIWTDHLMYFRPMLKMEVDAHHEHFESGPAGFSRVGRPLVFGGQRMFQTMYASRLDGATDDTVLTFAYSASDGRWLPATVRADQLVQLDDSTAISVVTKPSLQLRLVRFRFVPRPASLHGELPHHTERSATFAKLA